MNEKNIKERTNMTAKEYRDKEAITDANFWDGNEIDFDAIYEFAEDYHKAELKLLDITSVVNQRELLFTYENKIGQNSELDAEKLVDEYLTDKEQF